MVAVSFSPIATTPTLQFAQRMLVDSFDCLGRDDVIGAGVRIRQAARLLLIALAECHGIKRPLHKFPRPARIARALRSAGRIDEATLQSLLELITVCNATAHCEDASTASLRASAEQLVAIFDATIDGGGRPQ
jgi:hypothetical protein